MVGANGFWGFAGRAVEAIFRPVVLCIIGAAVLLLLGLANGDQVVGWAERLIRALRGG